MSRYIKVDLGCGKNKQPGFIGLDRASLQGVDVVADINRRLPFDDDSVELLFASHSLEHVNDLIEVMKEIYRICIHGAQVCIIAPYSNQALNAANPYHLQNFNEHTPRFWTNHESSYLDSDKYSHPQVKEWGLSESDNSIPGIDLRLLNMEYFYFQNYINLPEEELEIYRRERSDVCDQIMYHLVVVKDEQVSGEVEIQENDLYVPDYIINRRIRDNEISASQNSNIRMISRVSPFEEVMSRTKHIESSLKEEGKLINAKINESVDGVESKIKSLSNELDKVIVVEKGRQDKNIHDLKSEYNNKIRDVADSWFTRLDNASDQMDIKINDSVNNVESKIISLSDEIDKAIDAEKGRQDKNIHDLKSEYNNNIRDVADSCFTRLDDASDQMDIKINDSVNNVELKIKSLSDEIDKAIDAEKGRQDKNIHDLKSEYNKKIRDVTESCVSRLDNFSNQINLKIKDLFSKQDLVINEIKRRDYREFRKECYKSKRNPLLWGKGIDSSGLPLQFSYISKSPLITSYLNNGLNVGLSKRLNGKDYIEYEIQERGDFNSVLFVIVPDGIASAGLIGIEIIDPDKKIVVHEHVNIAEQDVSSPICIQFDAINIACEKWHLRIFERECSTAVSVLELYHYSKLFLVNYRYPFARFVNSSDDVETIDHTHHNEKKESKNTISVLAIGDGLIPSIELVLLQPLEYLKNYNVKYVFKTEDNISPLDFSGIDVVFCMRACTSAFVSVIGKYKKDSTRMIYALDDDFENIDPGTPLGKRYKRLGAWDNVKKLCSISDAVIVFSEYLNGKVSAYNRNTRIMPATANVELITDLNNEKQPYVNESIRIGYAGGKTHVDDVKIVLSAIYKIIEEYEGDVTFEIICSVPEGLIKSENIKTYNCVGGLKKYYELLVERNWDIAIAPLEDTVFNRSKSDNKFREYSACSIPGIYSNVIAYNAVIDDGKTGLLVNNTVGEWYSALKKLINDERLRKQIAKNSYKYVSDKYSIKSVSENYLELIKNTIRKKKILVCGPRNLPTVSIDIVHPFDILEKEGYLTYELKDVADISIDSIKHFDCLIIVRSADLSVKNILKQAKKAGVKTIYSWDDNFFEIPLKYGEVAAYYNKKSVQDVLKYVLHNVDMVKASTKQIADVSKKYNDDVVTRPYYFDFSLIDKVSREQDGDIIKIGYFGTVGRDSQFTDVFEALKRISDEFLNIQFEFFGFIPENIEQLQNVVKIDFLDNYDESIELLSKRGWDIGLSPLEINSFNESKLPTKYRDYAACGIAGVYSDIDSYSGIVKDGETGLLSKNDPDSWYSSIKRLILNKELRKSIADSSCADVYANYNISEGCVKWKQILGRLLD